MKVSNCNCLAGTAVIDANGNCGCVNNYINSSGHSADAVSIPQTATGNVTIYTPTQTLSAVNGAAFNLVEWLKSHKWLVIGGLAVILFMYMRGGGFSSREVVSTTRYGKK